MTACCVCDVCAYVCVHLCVMCVKCVSLKHISIVSTYPPLTCPNLQYVVNLSSPNFSPHTCVLLLFPTNVTSFLLMSYILLAMRASSTAHEHRSSHHDSHPLTCIPNPCSILLPLKISILQTLFLPVSDDAKQTPQNDDLSTWSYFGRTVYSEIQNLVHIIKIYTVKQSSR